MHRWVMSTAARVAERFYQERYARLFRAMSLPEAKVILGFPPTSEPSADEIARAYKKKVFENHPDKGGDLQKMVEVNVAKDVLDGKHKQRFRPDPSYNAQPPKPKPEPPKTVDTIKGQSFEQAIAGLPHAIWKAISKPEWAEHPRDENGPQRGFSSYVWALFGDDDHGGVIVLGLKQRGQNLIYDVAKGGNVVIEPDWQASHVVVRNPNTLDKVGPAAVKKVTSSFSDGAKPRRYPQKYVAFPGAGEMLEERMVLSVKSGSGGASLKDILLSTGLVSDDHPSLQGRKSNVEVIPHYSLDKYKRLRAERGKAPVYSYEAFDFEVRVNGKSATLTDDTAKNLKDNAFMIGVFGYDPKDNVPKNLTKLRPRPRGMTLGPKDAITLLSQALTGEPGWLHEALKKAASEYVEEEVKTAREAVRAVLARAV